MHVQNMYFIAVNNDLLRERLLRNLWVDENRLFRTEEVRQTFRFERDVTRKRKLADIESKFACPLENLWIKSPPIGV